MEYLRNAWYVAAWSEELTPGRLLARTLHQRADMASRIPTGADGTPFRRVATTHRREFVLERPFISRYRDINT